MKHLLQQLPLSVPQSKIQLDVVVPQLFIQLDVCVVQDASHEVAGFNVPVGETALFSHVPQHLPSLSTQLRAQLNVGPVAEAPPVVTLPPVVAEVDPVAALPPVVTVGAPPVAEIPPVV